MDEEFPIGRNLIFCCLLGAIMWVGIFRFFMWVF